MRLSVKYNIPLTQNNVTKINNRFKAEYPIYYDNNHGENADILSKTMTQNFEDFLIGIEKEEKEINPLVVKSNWAVKADIYNLPVLRIFPNFSTTKSGPSNGIKMIIDLETFDNADQGIDYDALQVIIGDQENFPLFDHDGISIRPGEMATLKVVPEIHDMTAAAASYQRDERKCVLSKGQV